MGKHRKYVFVIRDFRPETLPFDRLIAYYQHLAKLFGDAGSVRLSEIFESSHGSALRIEEAAVGSVAARFDAYRAGNPPADMERAREAIDAMLAEDATSGQLEDESGVVVVPFVGRVEPEERVLEVTETGAVVGYLYSWMAQKDKVHIRLALPNGRKLQCVAPDDVALKLRPHLKEDVRVFGRGTWRRESNGWNPVTLAVYDFEPLVQASLRDAVQHLRSLDVSWPEDPLGEIAAMNEEPNRLQ